MVDGNGINRTSGSKRKRDDSSPERTGPRKAIKIKRQDSPAATSHVKGTENKKDAALLVNTGKINTASFGTEIDPNVILDEIQKNGGIGAAGLVGKKRTTENAFEKNQPLTTFQSNIQETLVQSGTPTPSALGKRRKVNLLR